MNPDVHPERGRGGAASSSGAMDCAPTADAESVDRTAGTEDVSSPTTQVQFVRMVGKNMSGLPRCDTCLPWLT